MRPWLIGVLSLLSASLGAAPKSHQKPDVISVVVVGDVGLNRSGYPVHPDGVVEGSSILAWHEMTANVAPLIDGDLNFMNLETVVTDRNNLRPGNKGQKKPYLFRSHPNGVRHLAQIGFNLVSGANNHAFDYGDSGTVETVRHLTALKQEGLLRFSGIGLNRDQASAPVRRLRLWAKVAFSSIGIVTNHLDHHRATVEKPGTLGYRYEQDWVDTVERIAALPAELSLLSIHYGLERDVKVDDKQKREWRWAAGEKGLDLVIGHHAHVVRGVELHKGRVIFYGLGNFLIRGAANMGAKPKLRGVADFGLLAKVHFRRNRTSNHYDAAAIEVYPIFDMHRVPRRLQGDAAARRVQVLNVLAQDLDAPEIQSSGVRFQIRKDGSGLFCGAGANAANDRVAALCQGYNGPSVVSADVRKSVRRFLRRQ